MEGVSCMDKDFSVFLEVLLDIVNESELNEDEIEGMFNLINQTSERLGYEIYVEAIQDGDEELGWLPSQQEPLSDELIKFYASYTEFLQSCVAQDRNLFQVLTQRIKELEESK